MSPSLPPLKQYTLIVPVSSPPDQPPKVLLGLKKRGFGVGKFNGFGGKLEPTDVSVPSAASRELCEESSLYVPHTLLHQCAILLLEAVGTVPILEIHVFIADVTGKEAEVRESDEMLPRWFGVDELPLGEMWEETRHWLPVVLAEWVGGGGEAGDGAPGRAEEKRCCWHYVQFHGATNAQTGVWDVWHGMGERVEEWKVVNDGVSNEDEFSSEKVNEWLLKVRRVRGLKN